LKPVLSAGLFAAPWVASRAEAWIETYIPVDFHWSAIVASRAEAWIETCAFGWAFCGSVGRLPRGGVD